MILLLAPNRLKVLSKLTATLSSIPTNLQHHYVGGALSPAWLYPADWSIYSKIFECHWHLLCECHASNGYPFSLFSYWRSRFTECRYPYSGISPRSSPKVTIFLLVPRFVSSPGSVLLWQDGHLMLQQLQDVHLLSSLSTATRSYWV